MEGEEKESKTIDSEKEEGEESDTDGKDEPCGDCGAVLLTGAFVVRNYSAANVEMTQGVKAVTKCSVRTAWNLTKLSVAVFACMQTLSLNCTAVILVQKGRSISTSA